MVRSRLWHYRAVDDPIETIDGEGSNFFSIVRCNVNGYGPDLCGIILSGDGNIHRGERLRVDPEAGLAEASSEIEKVATIALTAVPYGTVTVMALPGLSMTPLKPSTEKEVISLASLGVMLTVTVHTLVELS